MKFKSTLMETQMYGDGDDAAHCANGLTAEKFRGASFEERAIYRRWIRGVAAFYGVLVLASSLLVVVGYSGSSHTQLTNLSAPSSTASRRAD
jgi:hypothetical protein